MSEKSLQPFLDLNQGSVNCDLWTKSGSLPVFIQLTN